MWVHESIKARPYLKPSWGDSEGIQMVKISGPRGEYVFANCYIEPDRRGSGFFVDRSAVFEELNAEFKNIRGKGWYPFAMGDFNTHTAQLVECESAPDRSSVDTRRPCPLARTLMDVFGDNSMRVPHGRARDGFAQPEATYERAENSVIDYMAVPLNEWAHWTT